jgi:hypothetical protein
LVWQAALLPGLQPRRVQRPYCRINLAEKLDGVKHECSFQKHLSGGSLEPAKQALDTYIPKPMQPIGNTQGCITQGI